MQWVYSGGGVVDLLILPLPRTQAVCCVPRPRCHKPSMLLFLPFLFLVIVPTSRIQGVQITSLDVPGEVRNGSGPAVLDCEYSLRASELATDSGLVVKWFWNNSPAPVYQWIPGQRPQDLGLLKGRLDLRYRASEHPATMHRALYIPHPTPKLSGEYKCSVSTFWDEDFMIKKMVVYATEKRLTVMHSRADFETVNVSCYAKGVYPEPKIFLYIVAENKTRLPVSGVDVETLARSGEYDTQATVLLPDTVLDTPTVFLCELRIPDTSYSNYKTITYYPGSTETVSSAMADDSSWTRPLRSWILILLALSTIQSQV